MVSGGVNAVLLNFLFIKESWKKVSPFPQKYYTVFNISNVCWPPNQHIRLISEGSDGTEDWSNDAENSASYHRNKLHFKIYYNRKQLF